MRILVTGASGLMGSALIPGLQAEGHTVLRLRRGTHATTATTNNGAVDPVWDPATGVLEPEPLEGLDVVIHLAGESVAGGRWTVARKKRIEVIVIGTTGATSLPMHIGTIAAQRGVPMLVVNPEPNPFSELVRRTGKGAFLEGTAGEWVPQLVDALPG